MIPAEWLQHAPKPRAFRQGEKWHVFLSYRSVNRTWVLNLYDILVELNFKVFMDQCELKGGDELIDRLQDGLRWSQAGVLMWSSAAEDSKWVSKEYQTLERKATNDEHFQFIPIKLDSQELPEFAANRIFMDFSSYPDGPNGGELIRLLHGIVGKPMDPATVRFANTQDEKANEAIMEINAAVRNGYAEDIVALSQSDILPWKTTPSLGCKAAESLIKLKKYNEAITVLQNLEAKFSKAIRPKQLHALALARIGGNENVKLAQKILGKLYEQGERDPETLGIYARTWMDRYNQSKNIDDLEQSQRYYAEAFEKAPDDYYTGVNAATKSLLLGTAKGIELAERYAGNTLDIVGTKPWPNDYWKTATVAELLLIKRQYADAAVMYREAIKMEPKSFGNHESTRSQAEKILAKLGAPDNDRATVLAVFNNNLN